MCRYLQLGWLLELQGMEGVVEPAPALQSKHVSRRQLSASHEEQAHSLRFATVDKYWTRRRVGRRSRTQGIPSLRFVL